LGDKSPWRSRRMKGESYKKRNSKGNKKVREKEKKNERERVLN
jgi:hypothetical protein